MVSKQGILSIAGLPRINYDGVVADSGGDHSGATAIQDADDALDAAAFSMLVKSGTYAGWTSDTDDAHITLGPGCVITSAVILSGDNIVLVILPGCDLQALLTMSGVGCHVICRNAVDIAGVLMSGNFGYFNGGGKDTLVDGKAATDGVQVTGTDCIVKNCRTNTTPGGGQAIDAVSVEAARCTLDHVDVVDSDQDGISLILGGTDCNVKGCNVLNADEDGIVVTGPRARVEANYIAAAVAGIGIKVEATGDNSAIVANVSDPAGVCIQLDANGDNCVVTANRGDGAITDNSTGSVVADNDLTAF